MCLTVVTLLMSEYRVVYELRTRFPSPMEEESFTYTLN
jgi:hypothetical protein